MTIKQHSVLEFDVSFDRPFEGGDSLKQSSVKLVPIIMPDDKNSVYLVVIHTFKTNSLTSEFLFESYVSIPFLLTPAIDVKPMDIYKCVQLTRDYLQNVLKLVFINQKSILEVVPIAFEEISDTLDEHINDLMQQLKNL
jgi:hypothetical protein